MAYWDYKPKNSNYVYVWYRKDGKNVPLPRSKTKHLDAEEPHNIDAFTNQIALKYEGKGRKVTPDNLLQSDEELAQYIGAYLDHLAKHEKRSANTVTRHRQMFKQYIVPFFLEGDHPLKDPAQWPGKSIRLFSWLSAKGASEDTMIKVNISVRGFYNYLVDEGRIQTGVDIKLRNVKVGDKATSLLRTVSPEEVLALARTTTSRDIKLMALLGYFGSLRPQETFAVRPCDFVAGTRAAELECGVTMAGKGLFSRLAINVRRQRTKNGAYTPPKSYSKGHVAIWHKEAAERLVAIAREFDNPATVMVDCLPDRNFKLWRAEGIKGITLKDLRRASLYHLSLRTNMNDISSLMKHARHKYSSTTALYLRTPEEDTGDWVPLDLEA